jgi:hypothetical protein
MSFEIHATDNGPVMVNNGNFVVLSSDDAMIDLVYEDGSRFNLIQNHIKEELKNAFDLYLEGFSAGLNPPAGRLYAYISALQQYWMFRNIKFANFLSALEEAEDEE